MKPDIQIATNSVEISRCYSVMRELRTAISAENFITRVQEQQNHGYVLAYLNDTIENTECVVAVAGFRISQNLAWGKFLYVDDLVTSSAYRSKGYGSQLLAWLTDYAKNQQCEQFHLDSGFQRVEAHRFYEREGLPKASYHFAKQV